MNLLLIHAIWMQAAMSISLINQRVSAPVSRSNFRSTDHTTR
jgi:hypothetical protein